MSTPNPALVAASPYLKQAIDDVIQAATTILTGDIALAPARVAPALGILVNQLALLAPGLLVAEEGAGLTAIVGQLNALKSRLP